MFTQADFDGRYEWICAAVIARPDRAWRRRAVLVRWRKSGEIGWVGERGASWPDQVCIVNHPRMPTFKDLPQCALP